jgi:hypothetical protein
MTVSLDDEARLERDVFLERSDELVVCCIADENVAVVVVFVPRHAHAALLQDS